MSRDDRYVPLPEVSERSETVFFGELGLPVDFDTERITVALPRLERVAHFGNIGHLTVVGFRGETSEESYGVGGVFSDGSGSAAGTFTATKAKLEEVNADNSEFPRFGYDWSSATVKVNNAEIEQRIRRDGDRWDKGLFDAEARAKYTNKAVTEGLQQVLRETALRKQNLASHLLQRVFSLGCIYFMGKYYPTDIPDELVVAVTTAYPAIEAALNHGVNIGIYGDELPKRQWSVLNFPQFDRYLAATALLRTGKIIKVAA